ncbi:unnamed protein product [Oikopleura dioica]|uniref:Uncharacterized protein n=1 Tax=Oikopleura dioica TaxID=34765 RepID=E4Y7A9_OIKDI|nr:unnamed protein product [Oikopleura dioica]
MSIINRFTNILQNSVEALAPQASSIEEFTFHWKRITNYYIESADEKEPVSRTNIPAHLQQMLDILIAEELELIEEFGSAENQTGPCLEHLLHQNILETLTTFGRGDTPPGMKQQVLHFATTLLGKIKQPLLPHVNVHKPVIKLVAICGEVMAAPTEKEEVHFLCVVCSKIKLDPYQVNFFVQTPTLPNIKRKSPNAIEQIAEELDDISTKESKRDEFLLAEGLLNLTKSPDQKIAVKACEGLMLLVGLPEAKASKTLVECTQLANFICCKLSKLISELPLTLDPADVESTEAKWGLDSYSAKEDKQAFTGKRQLRSFLSFLDFIDTLIEESHRVIGSTLAKAIKMHVFDKVLKDLLLATNENTALSITAVLTKTVQDCKSQFIIQQITQFMLGEGANAPEKKNDENGNNVRQTLITRCDHISDELAITTLRLFEDEKLSDHIFFTLWLFGDPKIKIARNNRNGPIPDDVCERLMVATVEDLDGCDDISLDRHHSDQFLIYAALADGESKIPICKPNGKVPQHILSAIYVINTFLPDTCKLQGNILTVKGVGHTRE